MVTFFFFSVLCWVFYQDLRYRGVYWWTFVLVLVGSLCYNFPNLSAAEIVNKGLFLLLNLFALTLYLTLKNKKLTAFWNGYFAVGDLLFLVSILPLFSFFQFVVFFSAGTIGTLLIHYFALLVSSKYENTIPFAGHMALLLCLFELFNWTTYLPS
jgi:hypothetical protein